MNNNRGNNRRRGRGNNSRPQNGGQQLNRIDSRARGNAPQLLEKYRKLAQDAHLNGDRVQAEYYLQFADHYFRVIADTRSRQEEARARREDRWQDNGEALPEAEDGGEFTADTDFPNFDTPPVYTRREREEPRRREEAPQEEASENAEADSSVAASGADASSIYEPSENPFLRENRNARGPRPRRDGRDNREDRRPRREDRAPRAVAVEQAEPAGIEAALPPAISAPSRKAVEAPVAAEAPVEAAPAPKRRAPRKKPVSDAGETLENAG